MRLLSKSEAIMHESFSRIIPRRLFAIFAIVALLFAAPAAAAPPPEKDPSDTVRSDKPPDKPNEQPVEKPDEKPKRIVQLGDGSVILSARDATVHGTRLRYERAKSTLGYWSNADDWVSWEFEITQPGNLIVDLTESCGPDSAGSHYTVEVGDQKLKDKVQETGSFRLFRVRRLGTLQFEKPGLYTLSVRAQDKPQFAVMDLRSIRLSPPKPEKPATPPPGDKKPAAAPTPSRAGAPPEPPASKS
jgi:hypothetical protein